MPIIFQLCPEVFLSRQKELYPINPQKLMLGRPLNTLQCSLRTMKGKLCNQALSKENSYKPRLSGDGTSEAVWKKDFSLTVRSSLEQLAPCHNRDRTTLLLQPSPAHAEREEEQRSPPEDTMPCLVHSCTNQILLPRRDVSDQGVSERTPS